VAHGRGELQRLLLGQARDDHPEARNYKRFGLPGNQYNWGAYHDRFDIAKEPNEGNRFGWIVEIDPFDPASTPKKRTALGRFKHEGRPRSSTRTGGSSPTPATTSGSTTSTAS
jgi:secreted PhoX family phosphatase